MGRASASADKTNRELKEKEDAILSRTSLNKLKELIPQHTDSETAEKLIRIVEESTDANLTIAAFKDKAAKLGDQFLSVASKIIKLI